MPHGKRGKDIRMNILVTGGCGFIGSNFIRYILKKYPDYRVVNLDKLTYAGNPENLKDIEKNPNYEFVRGDVCDKKTVDGLAGRVECIVNFAAETHVDRSIIEAGSFVTTDVYGTYNLLESVKKHGINRYVQISTDECYGSIQKGSFTEKSPLKPNSPYAASKAGGDLLCRSYFITYKLPVLITRSSNNFGPYQYPEKLIPLFVTNAIENQPLPLYGDGMNVRDWLYVEDNCEAIDLALHKGKPGEIYNVGGGNEIPNIKITDMILNIMNKPETLIKYVKDRPGHDRRYSLDSSKIRKTLGWEPKHNFESAIKETVNWYISNRDWWEKIKIKSEEFKNYYKKQYGS